MPTYTILSDSATLVDGLVYDETVGNFAALRGAAGSIAAYQSTDSNFCYLRATSNSNEYNRMDRSIFLLDATGFLAYGNPADITGVTFDFYPTDKDDDFGTGTQSISLVSSAPASNTSLAAGDYDSLGTEKYAPDITIGNVTLNQYNSFNFNSTGIQAVQTALAGDGVVKLGGKLTADCDNSAPVWGSGYVMYVYAACSENTTAARRPRLVITYNPSYDYFLSIGRGTYTVTGQNYLFKAARKMAITLGSYVLTGLDIGFTVSRKIAISLGSYIISFRGVGGIIGREWKNAEKNPVSVTNSEKNSATVVNSEKNNSSVTNQQKWI